MPRLRNHRRSEAMKRRLRESTFVPRPKIKFPAQHGTGPRQPFPKCPVSLLTDKKCKVVAPAQHPDKKTVLVVGGDQLGALVSGVVTIPEGRVSFGFLCVCKATTSDLKTEVIHANIPWTPDAVCVCVPVCNVKKQSIPKAVQDFEALLATLCFRWPKVFVLDFPPVLTVDPILQDAIRQEFRSVTESVGLTYVPVAKHFPSHRLELWCYDGVLSNNGAPILLQLLQDAAEQQLAVCAPLPEMSDGDMMPTQSLGHKDKKQTWKESTCVPRQPHGTGHRQPFPQGTRSLLTDKKCKVVAPAQHPDKKTVLVVGDGQLGALVRGVVTIPEGCVSFGFLCVYKATTSDLKTEVIHANIPWTPDAVCVCVPVCNVKQSIPKAVQDFEALLAAVCFRWPKVFVLDFPTDLIADPILQDAIRQEYRIVTESVGLTYVPVAEHFPSHQLELWCYDGVHLSEDGGVPILLQLLQDAADQQLAVCASLPETSVVGQCDVEETSPDPDAPVISGDVTTTVDADHPETTVVAQFRHSVNGWMTPGCPHPEFVFGLSRPKRSEKNVCRFKFDVIPKGCNSKRQRCRRRNRSGCRPKRSVKRFKYDLILKGYKSKRERRRRMNMSKKTDAALNKTSDKGCDPRWTAREERLDMQEKKLNTSEENVEEDAPALQTSVNGQITPECTPKPSEKQIKWDVMLRNPIFKRELRVNIFKIPTIAPLDKTPDEGLDHASHESEEHAQLATTSKTTATAALEEKRDEEFVPMSKEQLDMQEEELNTLEVKLHKKMKALKEDAQKLQTVKDKVAKQKQRIVRLKRELGAKDIQISLLKEELQLPHGTIFFNPESLN